MTEEEWLASKDIRRLVEYQSSQKRARKLRLFGCGCCSDNTLFFDTTTKAELYATAGVPEYWVIDLQNRRLLVFRDPVPLPAGLGATTYRTHLTFDPADSVCPLAAPAVTVRVADLLP